MHQIDQNRTKSEIAGFDFLRKGILVLSSCLVKPSEVGLTSGFFNNTAHFLSYIIEKNCLANLNISTTKVKLKLPNNSKFTPACTD